MCSVSILNTCALKIETQESVILLSAKPAVKDRRRGTSSYDSYTIIDLSTQW